MIDFDWSVFGRSSGFLLDGLMLSGLLVLVATVGGLILGAGLAAMRLAPWRVVSIPAAAYVSVMRSLPMVLVLFWFYFLIPIVTGRPTGALISALVAFVLFEAALYCEILRAGILSVRQGQSEAGAASGLRRLQVMRLIVLPQALRAMVPVLISQFVILFQDTSLVYVVALRDFMTSASVVAARDGRAIEMYTLVAVVYFAICFPISWTVNRRLAAKLQHS